VKIKPGDNFPLFSGDTDGYRNKLGIGEDATILVFPTENSGDTVVFYAAVSSEFLISVDLFEAGSAAAQGTISVYACINGNGEPDGPETIGVTVVEPQSVRQVKLTPVPVGSWTIPSPNPDKKLIKPGLCAVAMQAASYLSPTDVSFYKIQIGEGTCVGTGTGSQSGYSTFVHPIWTRNVSKGNITDGCRVEGPNGGTLPYDFIGEAEPLTVGSGTFTWVIPWEYSYGTAVVNKRFTTLTHQSVYDGNKGVRLSKAGNTVQHTTP
jgi:hypothetical protein